MPEKRFHHRKAHVTSKASDIDRKRTRLNEQSLLPKKCFQFAPEGLVPSGVALGLHRRAVLEIDLAPPQAVTNCKIRCVLCMQREQLAATDSSTAVWKSVVRSLLISPSMCASWQPRLPIQSSQCCSSVRLYIRNGHATAAKTVHVHPSSTTVHSVSSVRGLARKQLRDRTHSKCRVCQSHAARARSLCTVEIMVQVML